MFFQPLRTAPAATEYHRLLRHCERSLTAVQTKAGLVVGARHRPGFEARTLLCASKTLGRGKGRWVCRTVRLEACFQASFLVRRIEGLG